MGNSRKMFFKGDVRILDLGRGKLKLNRSVGKYNKVRRHGEIGWIVPAERYFKGMKVLQ